MVQRRERREWLSISNGSYYRILAKGRAILREVVIDYVYSRGAAGKSNGVDWNEVCQYQVGWIIQYFHRLWNDGICDDISQKLSLD